MAIRFDNSLNKEVESIVRRYNQKLRRLTQKLEREGEYLVKLPEKVSVRVIKKEYDSRRDLRKRLRELEKFTKRGSEELVELDSGLKITRYEEKLYKKYERGARRRLEARLNELSQEYNRVLGKKQFLSKAQARSPEYIATERKLERLERRKIRRKRGRKKKASEKEVEKSTSKTTSGKVNKEQEEARKQKLIETRNKLIEQFEKEYGFVQRTAKTSRINYEFANSFIKMLDFLRYHYDLDRTKVDAIIKIVGKLSAYDFSDLYYNERAIQALHNFYKHLLKQKKKDYKTVDIDKANLERLIDSIYASLDDIFGKYVDEEELNNIKK